MKNIFISLSLVAILALTAACNPTSDNGKPITSKSEINEAAETAAIMKVIEGETACFFNGDYDCWAKHWSHEGYVVQAWNNDNGTSDAAIGWDKINAQGKESIEKYYKNGKNIVHPVVRKDKPLVKFFNDKSAYLTWTQYNADPEKKNFLVSQETRVMEKDDEGWKIVNVSAFWGTKPKIPFDSLKVN